MNDVGFWVGMIGGALLGVVLGAAVGAIVGGIVGMVFWGEDQAREWQMRYWELRPRTAQLLRRYESEPDEPDYHCGRLEGHADVCAQLRAILDPENVEHLSLDGYLEAIVGLREQAKSLRISLDWYTSRFNEMQVWQRSVPEPYRTECCDILANGKVAPWRTRTETNE